MAMEFYDRSAKPPSSPSVAVDLLIAACIVLCAALLLVTLGACSEAPAEVVTAKAEEEAYEKKITLTFPIEYTATVTQCTVKDGCKTRYYSPRSK